MYFNVALIPPGALGMALPELSTLSSCLPEYDKWPFVVLQFLLLVHWFQFSALEVDKLKYSIDNF